LPDWTTVHLPTMATSVRSVLPWFITVHQRAGTHHDGVRKAVWRAGLIQTLTREVIFVAAARRNLATMHECHCPQAAACLRCRRAHRRRDHPRAPDRGGIHQSPTSDRADRLLPPD